MRFFFVFIFLVPYNQILPAKLGPEGCVVAKQGDGCIDVAAGLTLEARTLFVRIRQEFRHLGCLMSRNICCRIPNRN